MNPFDELRARIDCLNLASQITGASAFAYTQSDKKAAKQPTTGDVIKAASELWAFASGAKQTTRRAR